MLFRQLGLTAAVLLLAGPLRAATPAKAEADYDEARARFRELLQDSQRSRFRHHWNPVIAGLSRATSALPKGQRQCEAWFNLGWAWKEVAAVSFLQDDRDRGAQAYRELADRCPASSLADDGLFHAASLTARADPRAARRDLERLLDRYPKGDMAPQARELLATLPPAPREPPATVAASPGGERSAVAKAKGGTDSERPSVPPGPSRAGAPTATATAPAGGSTAAAETKNELAAAPAPDAPAAGIPGANLPSAADILAALDTGGADAHRPEDVALAEDLAADLRVSRPEKAEREEAKVTPDPERVHALEGAVGKEIPLSLVAGLKVKRVVIDAGHGGKDTGAIGRNGQKEKDLTLAIARKLRSRLTAMGLEVILTRDADVFLSLEERTRIANDSRADLFISIHVNAAKNRKAHGIETYTLNLNSDRYAMRLAARENATSTRSIGDLDLILADLATKANTDDSVRLARHTHRQMVSHLRAKHGGAVKDLGVKQALFFVLVGAKMPAVLVETGFISHPEEARRLANASYQDEIARSLAEGVRRFIEERDAIARGDLPASTGVF
ncbi:MAG TPA: N-acetylmuramoyl-L-alanine amidase [Vulgatibacter sp.]|nr:N-acetylmuramoyl-L-alanine amidase [Vulgatibacter sp.]